MTMPDWQDTSLGDSDAEEEREETVSNSHPAPSHPSPTPSDPHSPKQQYAAQTTLLLIEATPTMLDPRFGSAHSLAEVFASSTQTGDRPRSKLEIALRFVLALVKKRMVGSPKDKMGIMLFNTEEDFRVDSHTSLQHSIVLLDLALLSIATIRTLQHELQGAEKDPMYFMKKYAPVRLDKTFITAGLKGAGSFFRTRSTKNSHKNLWLITDVDRPPGSEQDHFDVLRVAKFACQDLHDIDCKITPFFFRATPESEFDPDAFYTQLLTPNTSEFEPDVEPVFVRVLEGDVGDLFKDFFATISRKEAVKRKGFSVPFVLGPGLTIGVNGYVLAAKESKKYPGLVDMLNPNGPPRQILSKTEHKDAHDSGVVENPSVDLQRYFSLGAPANGDKPATIFFDDNEMLALKNLGRAPPSSAPSDSPPPDEPASHSASAPRPSASTQPDNKLFRGVGSSRDLDPSTLRQPPAKGKKIEPAPSSTAKHKVYAEPELKLIGFEPRHDAFLRFEQTLKHSYFIYPSDEIYSGSTRTFAALLKSMLKKKKVGVATFVRGKSSLRMVMLLPQEEKIDSLGIQICPPGIHICQLPFADDIRPPSLTSKPFSCLKIPGPDVDLDELAEAGGLEQPLVDAATEVIEGLTLSSWNPDEYPNPGTAFFHEVLAALALGDPIPPPVDLTYPNNEAIEDRIGDSIAKFRALVIAEIGPEQFEQQTRSAITTSKKRRPPDAVVPTANTDEMQEFANSLRDQGERLTIKLLKAGLGLMGEKVSGNKPDLMERAWDAVEKRGLLEPRKKKKKKDTKKVESEEEEEGRAEVDLSD